MTTAAVAVRIPERRKADRRRVWTVGRALPYVILAILFWALGVIGYWALAPYNVLRNFDPGPRRIVNRTVYQGGTVSTVTTACQQMDVPGYINRAFVDGAIFPTPTVVSSVVGCFEGQERQVPIPVPHSLPPGRYHLDVTITYPVNPLRAKVYRYTTEEFEVLPADWRK